MIIKIKHQIQFSNTVSRLVQSIKLIPSKTKKILIGNFLVVMDLY